MKNPTLFKANIDKEEALELMDYLYCEHITRTEVKEEICPLHNRLVIKWFVGDILVAKWTEDYKNIMISKAFVDKARNM